MIVRVSREEIRILGDGLSYSTGSLLTLLPQRGEARIARAGGTESEVRSALLNAMRDGSLPASLRILAPGQDAWWDAQVAWPRTSADLPPPADDSEALLHNPLSPASWSPPGIVSLIRYALLMSSTKGSRWLRWPINRPRLYVDILGDFAPLERAELFDAVSDVWGDSRVVPPHGISRLRKPPWHLLWWTGPVGVVATTLYSVSHHWPLWLRVVATLTAALPAFLVQRKEEQLSRLAPRRMAAQQAVEAGGRASS